VLLTACGTANTTAPYHPLFVFNQFGDLERCALRRGNVHSADGWENVLKPVVARYRGKVSCIYFRADAGFANPNIYEYLEAEGVMYAIRLPANRVLQERIGYLLKRPVGRPPNDVRRSHANFTYQAGSWTKSRRVMTANSGFPPFSKPSERPDNGRRPPASSLACQIRQLGQIWARTGFHLENVG
jgi:hypothetical protein